MADSVDVVNIMADSDEEDEEGIDGSNEGEDDAALVAHLESTRVEFDVESEASVLPVMRTPLGIVQEDLILGDAVSVASKRKVDEEDKSLSKKPKATRTSPRRAAKKKK